MMKKIILFCLGALLYLGTQAQQLTFNSQYMLNQYLINPAAAGAKNKLSVATGFRQQWAGFKDAPKTQMISGNGMINREMGVGGVLYNDVTGPLKKIGFNASYAYHFRLDRASQLALGVSAMLTQHVLDGANFVLNDEIDNTLNAKQKSFNPDASFGVYYYGDNFFAGLSIPQLIENKYRFGDVISKGSKEVRHYYLSGGYKHKINKYFSIEPSVLIKYALNTPLQFDINARAFYKDDMWVGLSYRNKESIVTLVGMNRDEFTIGYSFDYTVSQIRKYSAGTHELYLGYRIPAQTNKHRSRNRRRSFIH